MALDAPDEARMIALENFMAGAMKWIDSRSFDHASRIVIKDEIARLEDEQAE